MPASDFLSCDWGTTSFRLRWIMGVECQVVREVRENSGIKAMLERPGAAVGTVVRADIFGEFLTAKLAELLNGKTPPAQKLPLIISGMASSSVGWRELPYARAPFPVDGSGLVSQELQWHSPTWIGPTYLISGVATDNDMMRGEECEIVGLMSLPELARNRQNCLLVLPGTHSKHVRIENGMVVDWRTFMTGEFFEVLGKHSLLRASVDVNTYASAGHLDAGVRTAFAEGVRCTQEHGMAGSLFRVRTRAVLHRGRVIENTAFLSGILIGAELMEIPKFANRHPVVLAGTGALADSYGSAFGTIGGEAMHCHQVPPNAVERAAIGAHGLFLARVSER